MLTVESPPGDVEPIHRHDATAFVYVAADTKRPTILHGSAS